MSEVKSLKKLLKKALKTTEDVEILKAVGTILTLASKEAVAIEDAPDPKESGKTKKDKKDKKKDKPEGKDDAKGEAKGKKKPKEDAEEGSTDLPDWSETSLEDLETEAKARNVTLESFYKEKEAKKDKAKKAALVDLLTAADANTKSSEKLMKLAAKNDVELKKGRGRPGTEESLRKKYATQILAAGYEID